MGDEFEQSHMAVHTPKNEIASPPSPYEHLAPTLLWPFFLTYFQDKLVIFSPRPYSLLLEQSHIGVSFAHIWPWLIWPRHDEAKENLVG